jgi:aminoglycoside phosphotransferase (APT) family kinase protein
VVCRRDLHPFNVLAEGDRSVVLDWTASQIAHPAYDLAFTDLLLANPPLGCPARGQANHQYRSPPHRHRFITTYRKIGPHPIDDDTLDWYRTLPGCRILTGLAS